MCRNEVWVVMSVAVVAVVVVVAPGYLKAMYSPLVVKSPTICWW